MSLNTPNRLSVSYLQKSLAEEQAWYRHANPSLEFLCAYSKAVNALRQPVADIHQNLHAILPQFTNAFEFAHLAFIATSFNEQESIYQIIYNQTTENWCGCSLLEHYLTQNTVLYNSFEIFALLQMSKNSTKSNIFPQVFYSAYIAHHPNLTSHEIMHVYETTAKHALVHSPAVINFCKVCASCQVELRKLFAPIHAMLKQADLDTRKFLVFETRLAYYFDRHPYDPHYQRPPRNWLRPV